MELANAVLTPIAAGALMWIVEMLLPEGRVARMAGAVAGIMVMQALVVPLLLWLGGVGDTAGQTDRAYISAQEVLTDGHLPGD